MNSTDNSVNRSSTFSPLRDGTLHPRQNQILDLDSTCLFVLSCQGWNDKPVGRSTRGIGIKGWKDFVSTYFACNPSGSPTHWFPLLSFFFFFSSPYRRLKPRTFSRFYELALLSLPSPLHGDQARFRPQRLEIALAVISPLEDDVPIVRAKSWNKVANGGPSSRVWLHRPFLLLGI